MATGFLHGVEVVEVDDGTRPLRAVSLALSELSAQHPMPMNKLFLLTPPFWSQVLFHKLQNWIQQANDAVLYPMLLILFSSKCEQLLLLSV